MKYAEMLKLGKEKINEALAPLRAREMKKQAEFEISKLESEIATKEQSIEELFSVYPIKFNEVIDAIDNLELIKLTKTRFENIIVERFSN